MEDKNFYKKEIQAQKIKIAIMIEAVVFVHIVGIAVLWYLLK